MLSVVVVRSGCEGDNATAPAGAPVADRRIQHAACPAEYHGRVNTLRTITAGVLASVAVLSCGKSGSREPIVQRPADDPELAAARREAHAHWGEFVAQLSQHAPHTAYAVKVPFPVRGGGAEHMWVQVSRIEGEKVVGVLDNEPDHDVGVRCGDQVTVRKADVEDWIVGKGEGDGNLLGGYSIKVLQKRK